MSRPAPKARPSSAGPLASKASDNVFCRASCTNLFFDPSGLGWSVRKKRRLDGKLGYLSSWDTTTEDGEEMDQVYDQVAFMNCGDLTTMRLLFPGVMTV